LTLWPDSGAYDFSDETVFVWQCPDRKLSGFASVSVRPWAEGCDAAPVPYVEGWADAAVAGRSSVEQLARLGRSCMTALARLAADPHGRQGERAYFLQMPSE
jgi:hypothetical protein